jgi:hypothetical protein
MLNTPTTSVTQKEKVLQRGALFLSFETEFFDERIVCFFIMQLEIF